MEIAFHAMYNLHCTTLVSTMNCAARSINYCLVLFILSVIGLDIQDNMGRHEVGFVDNVEQIPVEEGQGCRFKAAFKVNKV